MARSHPDFNVVLPKNPAGHMAKLSRPWMIEKTAMPDNTVRVASVPGCQSGME
jgi:hypothetical protein